MAKQSGGGSRGQKRAAKVKARRERIAQEELNRDAHARLVVERSGDPRFVQRVTQPDGSTTVSLSTETPAGRELVAGMERQFAAFRRKFGREPGPEDPIFFDPNADEPVPMTEQSIAAMFDEMIDVSVRAGVDPAFVKAWRDLGFVITEDNMHTFSAAEVEAWNDTVAFYADDEGADDDEDDAGIDEVLDMLDEVLRRAVADTLTEESAVPAREVAGMVMDGDLALREQLDKGDEDNEGGFGLSIAFTILAGWLTAARETQPEVQMTEPAVGWVRSRLGDEYAQFADRTSGLLGSTSSGDSTVQQLLDELQENFLPALIWLTAGLVAEFYGGDVTLLRSLHRSDDGP